MKSQKGRDFHEGVNWALNLLFWAVLILIGFCYTCIAWTVVQSYSSSGSTNTRGKHKTEVKVFIVLAVFLVCFAPDHLIGIQLQVQNKDSCMRESLKMAKELTLCLAATNVCLDPLIYFFLCKSFRENLPDLGKVRRLAWLGSGMSEEFRNEWRRQWSTALCTLGLHENNSYFMLL